MDKKLLTIGEAAEITGMSQGWWRAAIAGRKPMPPVRIVRLGGAIRINYSDLLNYINGQSPQKKRGRPKKTIKRN